MENININNLLNREKIEQQIIDVLTIFDNNHNSVTTKRGIYIYGDTGVGKTILVNNVLKKMGYDIITYNAGDIRNKLSIDTIATNNMSNVGILSVLNNKPKKIAIVMDEIDGMNNGDKGGINEIIKIIRQKKTKKQKLEEISINPIICIGNYYIDKKIKELMSVCETIEIIRPNTIQLTQLINLLMPRIDNNNINKILLYANFDLRKIISIYDIYKLTPTLFDGRLFEEIFIPTTYNNDTKKTVYNLIQTKCSLNHHCNVINGTDRTTVGLLWHENIIDVVNKLPIQVSIPFYKKQLDNICFADYIDRIAFQKQIWEFGEMSSLIKTIKNNNIYHDAPFKKQHFNMSNVRFTKVLTKYSTEYNNTQFINNLCHQMSLNKKDLLMYFISIQHNINNYYDIFEETYKITKLDINRIYRYIEKRTNYIINNTTHHTTDECIIDCDDLNSVTYEDLCV